MPCNLGNAQTFAGFDGFWHGGKLLAIADWVRSTDSAHLLGTMEACCRNWRGHQDGLTWIMGNSQQRAPSSQQDCLATLDVVRADRLQGAGSAFLGTMACLERLACPILSRNPREGRLPAPRPLSG